MSEKVDKSKIKIINSRKKAREIVMEIVNFGVNQDEIMHIIYLLALNLEETEKMKDISAVIKKYTEDINTEDKDDMINNKPKIIIQ